MALAGTPASAGENDAFGAEPYPRGPGGGARRSFEVPAAGGSSDRLRVYNRTDAALTLTVYAAAASVGEDGVVGVGFRGAEATGLARAITIAKPVVRLAPGAETAVPFEVKRIRNGAGSMAAVVVEGAPAGGSVGIDVVQRIAILVVPNSRRSDAMPGSDGSSGIRVAALLALLGVGAALAREVRVRRRAEVQP